MQFSLFGAEAGDHVLADLDGVLLGGGQWVENAGGARLSVVVADAWRAEALGQVFEALGVGGPGADLEAGGGHVARTAVTPVLRPLESRWRRGAVLAPPDDLVLSAGGLRLWAVTAGAVDDVGYVLRTPSVPDSAGPAGRLHRIAGALLARTGIAAVELGARAGRGGARLGPGWRITSARRLRRLAELLGPPPPGAEADWPPLATTGPTRGSAAAAPDTADPVPDDRDPTQRDLRD